jgi:hypothetical protein
MGGGSQGDNYFDEQMAQMRRVTSGQYEGLAPHIRAFYRCVEGGRVLEEG